MVPIRAALALAVVTAGALDAAPVSPAEMASYDHGFAAVQATTRSFHADLRQTLHLQGLTQPIVSLGTIDYQSPDRLLLRFSQPAGEWMLVNGSQAAIKKQGRPVERRDLAAGKTSVHAASLLDFFHSDPAHWHREFDVTMTRDGDLLDVSLRPYLTPTAPSQGVAHVVTTLRLPGYDFVGIEVDFGGGNKMDYAFDHGQRNAPIDPGLFQIPSEPKP